MQRLPDARLNPELDFRCALQPRRTRGYSARPCVGNVLYDDLDSEFSPAA